MRACLIFLVLLVSGAFALDTKTIVPSSTVPSKDALDTSTAVPLVDDKNKITSTPNVTTSSTPITTSSIPITTSSTTAPTTSTQAPTPVPSPQIAKWSINGTNGIIIVLRMAAQVDIMYNDANSLSVKKEINIPADTNVTQVSGTFEKNNETMKLSWKASNASRENSVEFHFNKNDQAKTYALGSVVVSIDASELPRMNETLKLIHSKEHFNTTLGHSYRCVKLQNFNLTKTNEMQQVMGQLKVTDFQFQAFKDDNKTNFGLAEDCAFDTSDVVPIAVGCVLAGLVVIVLVAYLISRRRSQARGYSSM